MGKKLEANGMWESSRMMLPEHKEAIVAGNRMIKVLNKHILDEQEIQIVDAALRESIIKKCLIMLSVYDLTQYRTVTGVVERVDRYLKRVKIIIHDPVADESDFEWIPLADINKAEVKESEDFGDLDW